MKIYFFQDKKIENRHCTR